MLLYGLLFIATLICGVGYYFRKSRKTQPQATITRHIPYNGGTPVFDPKMFFGRQELITTVFDGIAEKNFAIVGDFRMGKTSILRRLLEAIPQINHPEKKYFPLLIDMQFAEGVRNSSDFFSFLGRMVMDWAKQNSPNTKPGWKTDENYTEADFESDLKAIQAALQAEGEKQPVIALLVDEFTITEGYPDDTLGKLRTLLESMASLRIVVAGPRVPKQWQGFLSELTVETFTAEEARALIVEPMKDAFSFDDNAIELMLSHTGRRPLELNRLCLDIIHNKRNQTNGTVHITRADVEAVIKK